MPDSQNPDHVRKLIAEFQLKGANLIPTVTGEIVPTVVVADLTKETRAQDRLCIGGRVMAASGAGNQNRVFFTNPLASGVVATVERWSAFSAAAESVAVGIEQPATAISDPGEFRDGRLVGTPVCGTAGSAAAAIVIPLRQYALPVHSIDHEGEWIVSPGSLMRWTQLTQNAVLTVVLLWRERSLLPGE